METSCGDGLRALASRWSLAGDEKLLEILQNTHKKILSKCQEVNSKLDGMSSALDDASISLQNVNNKFMALSNSQFIESRVYDDDADVTINATPGKEPAPPQPSQESDLDIIRKSLSILQDLHEPVTIIKDSDTETDSEGEEERVVLKPKDLYSERPLPYIIGTEAWKNSWHAGLIPEDSDVDSESEGRQPPSPQYSDSEPEDTQVISKANATISETSSELASEQDIPAPKATPADIAADIARRLGGQPPKMAEPDPEYAPAMTVSKTVYRPQQPQTGTIFADEPPPLEEDTESSEEDDIFAELHTSRPKDQTRVVEDLFGIAKDSFVHTRDKAPQPRTEPRQPLFEDSPDDYEDRQPPARTVEEDKTVSKKPVGGISLFGSNKGAESIGAAILKRTQRKSTSEEDTDSEELPSKPKNVDQTDSMRKEKDIFDDLFAKSAKLEKKKVSVKNEKVKPVDLFSDNIFDDVGDVFTSKVMKKSDKNKSIFDDDDDDLFADIAPVAKVEVKSKSVLEVKNKVDKSLFDSDDELFAESTVKSTKKVIVNKSTKNEPSREKIDAVENKSIKDVKSISNESNIKTTKITKSIFDSDSDSDIFSDLVKKNTKNSQLESKNNDKVNTDIIKNVPDVKNLKVSDDKQNLRSPSLFDDDDDDLFNDTLKVNKEINIKERENKQEILNVENDEFEDDFPKTVEDSKIITSSVQVKDNFDAMESKSADIPSTSKEEIMPDEIVRDVRDTPIQDIIKSNEATQNFIHGEIEPELETRKSIVTIDNEKDTLFQEARDQIPTDSEEQIVVDEERVEDNNEFDNEEDALFQEVKDPISTKDLREQIINNNQTKKDDENDIGNDTLFQGAKDTVSTEDKMKQSSITNLGLDDDKDIEKTTLFATPKDSIPEVIFDAEPPVFEKAKEPKRSKNVNALFDDDSEDEALFFRKSDVEEKTENFPPGQSDRLFGIFHDEPPAIDDFGKGGTPDIFDTAIPADDEFQEVNLDTEIQEELKVSTPETSRAEDKSTKDDDIFKDDVPNLVKTENKPINIHNAFSEIKENEFDDIFKSANQIVHNDDEDIFKATSIDNFIKNTESDIKAKLPENVPETDIFDSKPEKSVLKSEIDFDSDEELFRTLPKPEKPRKVPEKLSKDETDEIIFKNVDRDLKSKTEVNKDRPRHVTENNAKDLERKDTENRNEIKKIGRVKSMNLNIDVATLLPGASPKRQKSILSPKERDEPFSEPITKTQISEKFEPKMIKSISFDGEPNSAILDNKLSKERAKIQVKRRPSTRKARREAVRKSVVDIDDSTDNSNSIDDMPKSVSEKSSSESPSKTEFKSDDSVDNVPNTSAVGTDDSNDKSIVIPKDIANTIDKAKKEKVTSKVVYILNDEDIFDSKPETEDLFKTETTISTIGSVYKDESNISITKKPKEINQNEGIKKSKVSIFDSDSDEDLFGKSRGDKKRVEVKGSLFGDDDDDDLFGVKSKKTDTSKPHSSKTMSKEKEKPSEPVFNDPLSMLGDD